MPFRWPFTFRRKLVNPTRAIWLRPVGLGREFVCAPWCRFESSTLLPREQWFYHWPSKTAYIALQNDAKRKPMGPDDAAIDWQSGSVFIGTGPAIPFAQDGNRAARTGDET